MRPLALIGLVAVLLAALLAGSRAGAHAQLAAADPPDGAVVAAAPPEMLLEFSEPVQVLAVRWFPAGGGAPREVAARSDGARVLVPVPADLGTGTHLLSWRAVSLDGHPVGGSLALSVGAPSAPAHVPSARAAPLAALAHAVLTLLLVLGVGGTVFLRLVDAGETGAAFPRRLALWSALAVPPAAMLALGLHGLDLLGVPARALAGRAPWDAALASPFAATAAACGLAGCAALAALGGAGGRALAGVGWGLAALSFALFGHAATAPPRWLTAPAVALHAAAVIFWIGALPGLAARAAPGGGDPVPTLRRFSALAMPLVAGLLLSGAFLAVVQVGRPEALLATAYGRLLSVKLALVAVLLVLAALNRLKLTPAMARGDGGAGMRFRRSVTAEIVLGLLILGVASGFRLTPPPRMLAAVPAAVHAHASGRALMAQVVLTPGRAGANGVEIGVEAMGPPLEPQEVAVAFALAEQGVEPIRLQAVRDGPVWRAGPVQLPYAGAWRVTVDVLVSDFAKERLETVVTVGR